MLPKFPPKVLQYWDQFIPPLLMAIWNVPHSSMQVLPFELLYAWQPQMWESWEQELSPSQGLLQRLAATRAAGESSGS